MHTTEKPLSQRNNNFNLLRLLSAVFVIITHSYALVGLPENDGLNRITHGLVSYSQLGLYSFFVISGFLIYSSLQRDSDCISFFKKRALRIFPALVVMIMLTVYVLGPLITILRFAEYVSNTETHRYLGGITLYRITYTLPGVFANNPYPHAVNGSLWTLPYEWTCYVLLAATFSLIRRRPRLVLTMGICGALALRTIVGRFHIMQVIPFLRIDVRQLLLFGTLFLLGALMYELRSHLPLKGWIACVAVVTTWLFSDTRAGLYILLSTLPYLIIYAAYISVPRRIAAWFARVDYSYGLYIYAFPLGQTLVMVSNNTLSVSELIVATIATTLPFAAASWHGIEKAALNLKKVI